MFHESLFHPETLLLDMARKKWTPQTEITDSLLKFREKRKWQLSYRRYVLERMPCEAYAPYFGLDIETLRQWFELQFTEELGWDNFGAAWQFDHIIPSTYFDYSNEEDLRLCWNFINIRVDRIPGAGNAGNRIDLLTARPYFQALLQKTGYSVCSKMLEKIETIESLNTTASPAIESFLSANHQMLETIQSFTAEEFNRLNQGNTIQELLLEREILKKFG
jgi:hypothetical protein